MKKNQNIKAAARRIKILAGDIKPVAGKTNGATKPYGK